MRADTLNRYFFKNKALEPHTVMFSVHEEEEGEEGRMLAEVTHERLLMGEGVSRVPVKEGSFQGVLFTPPGRNLLQFICKIIIIHTAKQ